MNTYQRQLYCLFVIFNFVVLQNIILISYAKPSPIKPGHSQEIGSNEVIDLLTGRSYISRNDYDYDYDYESSSEEDSNEVTHSGSESQEDTDLSQTIGSNEVIFLPTPPKTTTERIRTGYVYKFNLGVQEADSDESDESDPNIIRLTGNSRQRRAVVSNEMGYWNEKFDQMKSYLAIPAVLLVGIVGCGALIGVVRTLRSKNAQRIKDELEKTDTEGELKKTDNRV